MPLQLFKALSDNTRLRIVYILSNHELSVNELAKLLGMGQSRISRHLKILVEAGILKFRRDGLWVFYSVSKNELAKDFLKAIMPFIQKNENASHDLFLCTQILEERTAKTRQFFNSIADSWDALNQEILGDFNLIEHILHAMPKPCPVSVDLGCGTGEVLLALAKKSDIAIGVDGSARMLELCSAKTGKSALEPKISLRIGELCHLPLADSEANFACINLVLHHLPKPEDIFREIKRVLVHNGNLFIADFLQHSNENMRTRYGDYWLGFDMEKLANTLNAYGFTVSSQKTVQVAHQLTIFMLSARLI